MTLSILSTILFVAVLFMAWRRGAWLLAFVAVLLGVAIGNVGGSLDTAATGLLSGIRSAIATASSTLFS